MKKLSFIDSSFLRLEDRKRSMHVGVLMLFHPPRNAADDFVAKLYERLWQHSEAAEPFNWIVEEKGRSMYWKVDPDFDLENHFVHMLLPKPGRIRELLSVVSRLHSSPLDRTYPLWRLYLIEGIEDGRFALFLKIHHAMADGVAVARILVEAMAPDVRSSKKVPALWAVPSKQPDSTVVPLSPTPLSVMTSLRSMARQGVMKTLLTPMPVLRELNESYREYRENKEEVMIGLAPKTVLSSPVSSTRRCAAQSYSRKRIKAVANAYGATGNDVVLAMCGGAIRRYLIELENLPEQPVMGLIPVSTRVENVGYGNELSFTATHLGTHIEDPGERMRAIQHCMNNNKKHLRALSPAQQNIYASAMMLPGIINSVAGFAPDRSIGGTLISHVPGPQQDLYWQGAKLDGFYPLSQVMDGTALNVTIVSRHDNVDFGLVACRKNVPHMQRLLKYLEDALVELEESAPS